MLHKAKMLEEIKNYYGFVTDTEFASYLEIKPQVLSNWKSRNTFDAELLYRKCKELNPAWLLCQEGPMLTQKELVKDEVNEESAAYLLQKEIRVLEKQLRLLQKSYQSLEKSEGIFKKAITTIEKQLKLKKELLQGK